MVRPSPVVYRYMRYASDLVALFNYLWVQLPHHPKEEKSDNMEKYVEKCKNCDHDIVRNPKSLGLLGFLYSEYLHLSVIQMPLMLAKLIGEDKIKRNRRTGECMQAFCICSKPERSEEK